MSDLASPDWVESRPYQRSAIQSWFKNNGRGIFRMATGTGKTVTALLVASRVTASADDGFLLIVTVPYQHLVDQWAEAIRDFGGEPIYAYNSRKQWQPRLEQELLELNQGVRDTCIVVTTHQTLSSEPTRRTLSRASVPSMLVGDEVHHLGAPHRQKGLISSAQFRLGLSATPVRWYDDTGTDVLNKYFGNTIFDYNLQEAIDADALCEYYYIPHIVELNDEELEVYRQLSEEIGRNWPNSDNDNESFDLDSNPKLKHLLFKRARLVGTAEAKLDVLTDLLDRQSDPEHTLVYCSDGSTGAEPGVGQRHVDVTTEQLRSDCGFRVSRFTSRESREERKRILNNFEDGTTEILTSIRCLDEGVDVPATRTAYILASTTNPRQYIQRRGRILRNHPGKNVAVIHDFITIPDSSGRNNFLPGSQQRSEKSMVRNELTRALEFAEAARNHPDAEVDNIPTTDGTLQHLKRKYDLLDL